MEKNACSLFLRSLASLVAPPSRSFALQYKLDSPVQPAGAARRGVPRESGSGLGARPRDVAAADAPDRLRKEVGARAGPEHEGDVGEGARRGHLRFLSNARGSEAGGERERAGKGKEGRGAFFCFLCSRSLS